MKEKQKEKYDEARLDIVLLCGADILARSVAATELPVSIFTSLLGAPFLIFLILQGRKAQ